MTDPEPTDDVDAASVAAARYWIAQALTDLDEAAALIAAAMAAQERDRKGRLLAMRGLQLWGITNAIGTARRALNGAVRRLDYMADGTNPR